MCIVSGGNKHAALKLAGTIGIEEENVKFHADPETKKKIVEVYQKEGRKVLYIGSGAND